MAKNGTKGLAVDLHEMLGDKEAPDLDKAIQLALEDERVLREMIDGIISKENAFHYNCFKALRRISDDHPSALVAEWDYFVELLGSSNSFHRSMGLRIIANLTQVDDAGRFEGMFDQYFGLLDDKSVIPARYLAQDAGQIIRSKPHLRARIVDRLLAVDETHHTQSRKDLIKADVVQTLEEFFDALDNKAEILAFVEAQLASSSPKARNAAKAFLRKYGQAQDATGER